MFENQTLVHILSMPRAKKCLGQKELRMRMRRTGKADAIKMTSIIQKVMHEHRNLDSNKYAVCNSMLTENNTILICSGSVYLLQWNVDEEEKTFSVLRSDSRNISKSIYLWLDRSKNYPSPSLV
ncbi:hypothetical protein Peur_061045 [Populus x canadensis]|jgi:hypothetical protein